MHIDIVTKTRKCYDYENYAAGHVCQALEKLDISHRMLAASEGYLYSDLAANSNDWILSFCDVCELDRPVGDFFRRPTFQWSSYGVDPKLQRSDKQVFDAIMFENYPIPTPNFPLHLFGYHEGTALFKTVPKTISLHGPCPYLERIKLCSMSKILISDFDENVLPALFSGSLVLTPEDSILKEMVGNQFEIFYPPSNREKLEERVHFFLENPKQREQTVLALKEHLIKEHTWDLCTKQMVTFMESQ